MYKDNSLLLKVVLNLLKKKKIKYFTLGIMFEKNQPMVLKYLLVQ
jgi:hypothetical protein